MAVSYWVLGMFMKLGAVIAFFVMIGSILLGAAVINVVIMYIHERREARKREQFLAKNRNVVETTTEDYT